MGDRGPGDGGGDLGARAVSRSVPDTCPLHVWEQSLPPQPQRSAVAVALVSGPPGQASCPVLLQGLRQSCDGRVPEPAPDPTPCREEREGPMGDVYLIF